MTELDPIKYEQSNDSMEQYTLLKYMYKVCIR